MSTENEFLASVTPEGKRIISFGKYKGLTPDEGILIGRYLHTYNKQQLICVLESGTRITTAFRCFISDALTGEIKAKKPAILDRDNEIFLAVQDEVNNGKTPNEAFDIVGDLFHKESRFC